jgi:hypothetical protein
MYERAKNAEEEQTRLQRSENDYLDKRMRDIFTETQKIKTAEFYEEIARKTIKHEPLGNLVDRLKMSFELREIDPGQYEQLLKSASGYESDDNPLVLAELGTSLANGGDISDRAFEALQRGQLKGSTYATMVKASAQKGYGVGIGYIDKALAPTGADKWDYNRNRRWAEAHREYNLRVSQGENPADVAWDINDRYGKATAYILEDLPAARGMDRSNDSVEDHMNEMKRINDLLRTGKMSIEEHKIQAEILKNRIDVIRELDRVKKQMESGNLDKRVLQGLK